MAKKVNLKNKQNEIIYPTTLIEQISLENTGTSLVDYIDNKIVNKSEKEATVSNVEYTNKTLTKTINEVTTDVVSASEIVADGDGLTKDEAARLYATEEFVTNKIAEAQLGGEDVDLSGYAEKSYVENYVDSRIDGEHFGTINGFMLNTTNFEDALNKALDKAKGRNASTIDMTGFIGHHTCNTRFVIDFPVTILLGNVEVEMNDSVFFHIKSNNVVIQGVNRVSDKKSTDTNSTRLILKGISQDPTEGYHIYSRGYKSCQYRDLVLKGIQSSVESQQGSASTPIDGTGGIFIEKENPGTTGSGNTVNNTILERLLIDGTKAAGIYLDTPILSTIKEVRVSSTGGHGIYINGGTSIVLESVYVASANYAGICMQNVIYASVLNCVAETCGCGFWLRGCSNISLFSPGVESTTYLKANPWNNQYSETSRYGKGLTTTSASGEIVKINDVPNESWKIGGQTLYARGLFLGYAFVITGGKYINMFTPYATSIAESSPTGASLSDNISKLSYMLIMGSAKNITISNFGAKEPSSSSLPSKLYREIAISSEVDGVDLTYNMGDTVLPRIDDKVTDKWEAVAPIFNECKTIAIHSGNVNYTELLDKDNQSNDDKYIRRGENLTGYDLDDCNISLPIIYDGTLAGTMNLDVDSYFNMQDFNHIKAQNVGLEDFINSSRQIPVSTKIANTYSKVGVIQNSLTKDIYIETSNTDKNGLMSLLDKAKLDQYPDVKTLSTSDLNDYGTVTVGNYLGNLAINKASSSLNGLMSTWDKNKLDSIKTPGEVLVSAQIPITDVRSQIDLNKHILSYDIAHLVLAVSGDPTFTITPSSLEDNKEYTVAIRSSIGEDAKIRFMCDESTSSAVGEEMIQSNFVSKYLPANGGIYLKIIKLTDGSRSFVYIK